MENSLKQRIIGAIVLIALAVIFLPSILKEKEQQEPFISKIPAKPIEAMPKKLPDEVISQNEKTQQALDDLEKSNRKTKASITESTQQENTQEESNLIDNTNIVDPNKVDETKNISEDISKIQTQAEASKTDATKIIGSDQEVTVNPTTIGKEFQQAAWIIQIASFSNKDNALNFVDKLKTAGHKAYRQEIKNNKNQTIYRIYTGPYIRKEDAEKALAKVNEVSKLQGIIVVFDPTKL